MTDTRLTAEDRRLLDEAVMRVMAGAGGVLGREECARRLTALRDRLTAHPAPASGPSYDDMLCAKCGTVPRMHPNEVCMAFQMLAPVGGQSVGVERVKALGEETERDVWRMLDEAIRETRPRVDAELAGLHDTAGIRDLVLYATNARIAAEQVAAPASGAEPDDALSLDNLEFAEDSTTVVLPVHRVELHAGRMWAFMDAEVLEESLRGRGLVAPGSVREPRQPPASGTREDTERLDWLEANHTGVHWYPAPKFDDKAEAKWILSALERGWGGSTLRDAIDAARAATPPEPTP